MSLLSAPTLLQKPILSSTLTQPNDLAALAREDWTAVIANDWPAQWTTFGAAGGSGGGIGTAITSGTAYDTSGGYMPGVADGEMLFRFQWAAADSERYVAGAARWNVGTVSGYRMIASQNTWGIQRLDASALTVLTQTSRTFNVGTWYWMRFRWHGSDLRARSWTYGTPEPLTWDLTVTDTTYTTAQSVLIEAVNGNDTNADTVDLANFSLWDFDAARRLVFDVTYYGAKGDGTTDDTAAIQAAINAASAAGGGLVYFPAGFYLVSASLVMHSSVYLLGGGPEATVLQKSGNFPLLKFWGSATGANNHLTFAGVAGMTLDGDGHTGTCLDLAYCTRLVIRDVHCTNNVDLTLDTVEVWDSRFYNFSCDNCGSTTSPVVRIGTSRAASGFGSSTDSTNQLMFFGLLIETWKAGAILLDPGLAGDVQQIYLVGMKIETTTVRGPAIKVSGTTRDVHMDDVWVFMGDFDSGFSTAQNAITVFGDRTVTLRGTHIANNTVATIASGVEVWNDHADVNAVHGSYITAPTTAHVTQSGGNGVRIGHVSSILGMLLSGTFVTVLTDAATIATDASLGDRFRVTLGGNRTLGNPTNPRDGQVATWEIIQDATGSRTLALGSAFALGTTITSTTLTTTASKRDLLTAQYNATTSKWYVTQFVKGY